MGRAPCCDKANVKRGPWSPEEDIALKSYVEMHGTGGNWIALPQKAGLKRCGKSCRLRWLNYLRPGIKHGGFTEEEDNVICSLYKSIGSRWSVIASHLPGRTDNDVKNYWNTKLKKKLLTPWANPNAEQNNSRDINRTRHGTSPSPLSRGLRVVNSEDYDVRSFSASADYSCSSTLTSTDDAHLGFNLEPASLPTPAPALVEPPNSVGCTSGYVVSPPHDISAASPSFTTENSNAYASWPDIGSSELDAFLSELGLAPMELLGAGGFEPVDKVGDVGSLPVGVANRWSHAGSTPKELHQGFAYS